MDDVEVSYLPNRLVGSPASVLRRAVRLAEDAELDGLGAGDHVSFYGGFGADGLVASTSILAASERLSAVVGVYLLPLRHPVPVARQLADLSSLAPGRLVLGLGIGGEDRHEIEVCGIDPHTRGRRMDECLEVLRGLLTGEPFTYEGEFLRLDQAVVLPAPAEPIPLLVGGRSDAAILRAGQLGDGWFGIWVSPRRYAEALELMASSAADADRTDVQWTNALNVWCGVGDTRDAARHHVASAMQTYYQIPYDRFEKWSPAGPPAELADFLAPYVDAGCHHLNLIACGESLDEEVAAVGEVRRRLVA